MNRVLFLCVGVLFMACLSACLERPPAAHLSAHAEPSSDHPEKLRVLALDWGTAATLTAMGHPPIATGDVKQYPDWTIDPPLPPDIIDMGARFSPNPEMLAQVSVDLVINTDFYQHLRPMYGDITHLEFLLEGRRYEADGSVKKEATWADYVLGVETLGKAINQEADAARYIQETKARLEADGRVFRANHPQIKKIAIVQFTNANHARNYTKNSLFKPALDLMGLSMQTLGEGNAWGFSDIGLSDLAKLEADTCLVVIEPFSPMLRQELAKNTLWQRLGFGVHRCLIILPPTWIFGGLPSMVGLSSGLAHAKELS